ncbi:the GLUG motif subfamily [Roseburia sp. CAG:100]|nr:the GLUG motif subfamily [Roseburia sp. CAG:100]
MPTDFWHLKVTFKIDDMYLGTQELAYGDSLSKLTFPQAPAKDNCYGVWPDVSDRVMTGNLVIEGEYKDNVTVVQSDSTSNMLASDEGDNKKALVLVEGVFTEDAVLHTTISDEVVPQEVTGKNDYTVYQVSLENTTVTGADTLAVRLLNPYKKAAVWSYLDGEWQQVDSKVRGQYLQTAMKGAIGTFCIVEESSNTMKIIIIIAVCAAVVVLLLLLIRKLAGRHRNKEKKKKKKKQKKPKAVKKTKKIKKTEDK